MNEPVFSIRVRVELERFPLDVDLRTTAQRVGIFGPSGAGKTTLLESLAGWRRGVRGRVAFGPRVVFDSERGVDLALDERRVGYVPQEGLVFPHRTVLANLRAGALRARGTESEREAWTERVLDVLELRDFAARLPATLSGGELRRVALGRALCSQPDVLLLDEPLSALDVPLRRRILSYLARTAEEFALPMLYVSHEAAEVSTVCDEVVLLREGKVVGQGRAADLLAESFLASAIDEPIQNVLHGDVAAVGADNATVAVTATLRLEAPGAGLSLGDRVALAIRADEILLARERPERLSARNVLAARVVKLYDGDRSVLVRVALAREGPELDVQLTHGAVRDLDLAPGADVYVVVKSHSCRVLSSMRKSAAR